MEQLHVEQQIWGSIPSRVKQKINIYSLPAWRSALKEQRENKSESLSLPVASLD